MSPVEACWVLGALFGVCFSILALGIYGRASMMVVRAIRSGEASFAGPRWKYTFGTLVAMGLFLPGWVAFLLTGLVAASTPENPNYHDATTVELLFELLILGGELAFAAGQVGIVLVWWAVRSAAVFVPPLAAHRRTNVTVEAVERVQADTTNDQP